MLNQLQLLKCKIFSFQIEFWTELIIIYNQFVFGEGTFRTTKNNYHTKSNFWKNFSFPENRIQQIEENYLAN